MIFNCVRSNLLGQIGFLKDIRRLNVGLTRSKHFLFVIGNSKTLIKNKIWGDFIRDCSNAKNEIGYKIIKANTID